MQIEKISKKKIKIILTENDLILYSVSPSDLYSIGNRESEVLGFLLKEATFRTGFEATEKNISVSANKVSGGYEIYITQISGKADQSDYDIYFLPSCLELITLCARMENENKEVWVWHGDIGWFIGFLKGDSPYYIGDYGKNIRGMLKEYVAEYCKIVYRTSDIKRLASVMK